MRVSLSLPDIVRVPSFNEDAAIAYVVAELEQSGHGFNYLDASKRVKAAYKGLHDIKHLTMPQGISKNKVGQKANLELVSLAAPISFGRRTNVFDLEARRFHYGEDRSASYRIPFFFSEQNVIKAYYLQPRKGTPLTLDQVGLYASIVKKFLLDQEFYGESVEVEIVDVAEREKTKGRSTKVYGLSNLDIWNDDRINSHLRVVRAALDYIEAQNLVTRRRRPLKDRDLPLFF
ncbi:hypothetical protein FZ934_05165 [Rhizobium grahamii]|uniref:Uncharacterized protein n=1 Tax=Rhizobium grahamii TaxID=1120045 RepID=A0A5Q0C6F8_9HYPH|nr:MULTISPECIES: hypothetical protein [Rhizobium]QFY59874.1 hypothetical protein FZ934_05165 [Rhizobium grahamii]QRM51009.1 hypothetical protein F3Y33_17725 [Rhizobium sp. BG6]